MHEAVRAYLTDLLRTGRFNRTRLAKALGTSRSQLNKMLLTGNLTAKQIDTFAERAPEETVTAVLSGLQFQAEKIQRGEAVDLTIPKDEPELPGRVDARRLASGELEVPSSEPQATPPPAMPSRRKSSRPARGGSSSR